MRIKRFFADDIRDAIRQVREEMGADAVILSNRAAAGGVEIVAAVDYDDDLVMGLSAGESGTRRDEPAPAAPQAEASAAPAAGPREATGGRRPRIVWSQEPALVAMRKEINAMRGLLEQQLSGFAWSDLTRHHPRRAALLRLLLDADLSPAICEQIAERVPEELEWTNARRMALGLLAHRVQVTGDDILNRGGVVALIGSTGVGKTTTVAKLAARFALRHGARSVALVTTDNYRIGAHEQLRTYAQVMDVPLRVAKDAAELDAVLKALHDRKLVLIDTAGMSQRDKRLAAQVAMLGSGTTPVQCYLVLAATTQHAAMRETIDVARAARARGCILTKIDEAASLGGALSAAIDGRLPVAYIGDGQRVPEDLHPARAHTLVTRMVALSQQEARRESAAQRDVERGARSALQALELSLAFGGKTNNAHA